MNVMIHGGAAAKGDGMRLCSRRRDTGLGCCCKNKNGLGLLGRKAALPASGAHAGASLAPAHPAAVKNAVKASLKSNSPATPTKTAVKKPAKVQRAVTQPSRIKSAVKDSLVNNPAVASPKAVTARRAAQPGQTPLMNALLTRGQQQRAAGIAAPTRGQQQRAAGLNVPTVGQRARATAAAGRNTVFGQPVLPGVAAQAPMEVPSSTAADEGDGSQFDSTSGPGDGSAGVVDWRDSGPGAIDADGGDDGDDFDAGVIAEDEMMDEAAADDLYGDDEEDFDAAMLSDDDADDGPGLGAWYDDELCRMDARGVKRCPRDDASIFAGGSIAPIVPSIGDGASGSISMLGGNGDDELLDDSFDTLNGLGLLGAGKLGDQLSKAQGTINEWFGKIGGLLSQGKPTPAAAAGESHGSSHAAGWTTGILLTAGVGTGLYFLMRRKRRRK